MCVLLGITLTRLRKGGHCADIDASSVGELISGCVEKFLPLSGSGQKLYWGTYLFIIF